MNEFDSEESLDRHSYKVFQSPQRVPRKSSDRKSSQRSLSKTPAKSRVFHTLLAELSNLKAENSILKKHLADKMKPSRCSSKMFRAFTPSRHKPCLTCFKLLSKGFTTKFCPIHGYDLAN